MLWRRHFMIMSLWSFLSWNGAYLLCGKCTFGIASQASTWWNKYCASNFQCMITYKSSSNVRWCFRDVTILNIRYILIKLSNRSIIETTLRIRCISLNHMKKPIYYQVDKVIVSEQVWNYWLSNIFEKRDLLFVLFKRIFKKIWQICYDQESNDLNYQKLKLLLANLQGGVGGVEQKGRCYINGLLLLHKGKYLTKFVIKLIQ